MWCKSAVSFSAVFSLQLAVSARPPVTRRPDPASGACFGLADSPWLRPFPPAAPQALALPCSPPSPVVLPHPTSSFRAPSDSESSFPLRPRFDCRGGMKTSQVPTKDVRTCLGSSTPWSPSSPHRRGAVGVAFDRGDSLGAPELVAFDAQLPRPSAPLSTLRLPPHSDRRMTRGEGGRLLLPSTGLPPAVLRQFAWRTTARQRRLHLPPLIAAMLRAPESAVPELLGLPPPPA